MAIILVPTDGVVSSCDVEADFTTRNSGANINATDDDFVEGTGAMGDKMSNTTELLVSDNLGGGAAGVYDFSIGGSDEGAHFIGWCNAKTPFDSADGLAIYFRNAAGHFGTWNTIPSYFYKGGFTTRVGNPSRDFDNATTWTTGGNPAQLDDVSEMGFQFHTTSSIMGSFNNCQVDQFTVGYGVRAIGGKSGTPNTFDAVKVQDQDTSFWGWWSEVNGNYVGKAKLYIGPETGDSADYFVDTAFAVTFADENVAEGFYEIPIRGGNTTCDFSLATISAGNPTTARWSLTVDSATGETTGGYSDTNCLMGGYNTITLNQYASTVGTTYINGTQIIQNNATMTGVAVLNANVGADSAALLSDNLTDITGSTFEHNGVGGHAIEIDTAGSYTSNNTYTGYSGDSANATIWFNPTGGTGDLTLSVTAGSSIPTVRNSSSGTVTINLAQVVTTINAVTSQGAAIENARVLVEASSDSGDLPYLFSVGGITRSGSTASVQHTAHGLATNDKVLIRGADQQEYNGVREITFDSADGYTYTVSGTPATPATGTLTSTGIILDSDTDAAGQVSNSPGKSYTVNQPVRVKTRRATISEGVFYKATRSFETIDKDNGLTLNVQLTEDE
jgi:hypothetical protein